MSLIFLAPADNKLGGGLLLEPDLNIEIHRSPVRPPRSIQNEGSGVRGFNVNYSVDQLVLHGDAKKYK